MNQQGYDKTIVFMIPYAGASVYTYLKWKQAFPPEFEVHLNELAGRGSRFGEPCYPSIRAAALDMAAIMKQQIASEEYCIFGHSMGALIAYELYYQLSVYVDKPPKHIFLSGRSTPDVKFGKTYGDIAGDEDFLREIQIFNGMKDKTLPEELRKLFLPVIRSDFSIVDQYQWDPAREKLACGVTVFFGDEDLSVRKKDIMLWERFSATPVEFVEMQGDHFFIDAHYQQIVAIMVDRMKKEGLGAYGKVV